MPNSEDVRLKVDQVKSKKVEGTLYMMNDRMAWMPKHRDVFTLTFDYCDIKCKWIVVVTSRISVFSSRSASRLAGRTIESSSSDRLSQRNDDDVPLLQYQRFRRSEERSRRRVASSPSSSTRIQKHHRSSAGRENQVNKEKTFSIERRSSFAEFSTRTKRFISCTKIWWSPV